jgi:hypothetical protein
MFPLEMLAAIVFNQVGRVARLTVTKPYRRYGRVSVAGAKMLAVQDVEQC